MNALGFVAVLCWLVSFPAAAQDNFFTDPLLDRLAGRWVMTGTIGGEASTHDLVAEWVLGHQYLRFHEVARETDSSGAPAYEAIVFIGWDEPHARYSCLWLDVTGTSAFSPVGFAEPATDELAFVFDMGDGGFIHTTFVYRADTDTWDWRIDIARGGKISQFARVTLTKAPTPIPIDINSLTDEQRSSIQEGHDLDPTPYLMKSRPIVCQIVETPNNAAEVRSTGLITERAPVMIYALGEADGDRLVDYGWLDNVTTGQRVWTMTYADSEPGGGDPRNRKASAELWLEPGEYELHYVSNESHAFGDWRGDPPERERFYGIVVFNLDGIRSIRERWAAAGIGGGGP